MTPAEIAICVVATDYAIRAARFAATRMPRPRARRRPPTQQPINYTLS